MQRSLGLAFNSWRSAAIQMQQHGANLVLAVTKWQQSHASSAFHTWLEWVDDRKAR